MSNNAKRINRVKKALLLGKKGIVVEDIASKLESTGVQLFGGTCLADVENVFSKEGIDTVIMGAGLDINDRLEIIKTVFDLSNATTVHMKDFESGHEGMLPFVNGVLKGLEMF
jgi:hypothetical protein